MVEEELYVSRIYMLTAMKLSASEEEWDGL